MYVFLTVSSQRNPTEHSCHDSCQAVTGTGPDLGVAVEQDEDAVLGPQLGHAQHAGAPGLGTRVALSPGHGHCGARGLQRPADAVKRVDYCPDLL